MPKISVIIPVYNAEKYLAECLDSVIAQTFTDIEIICINDGSTDDSLKILHKYAKKDSRIKIINQKNSGVVIARNKAIAHASGTYVYPLDADDVIASTCLEKLYNAITDGYADIITSRVMYFGRHNNELVLPNPNKYNMSQNNCLVNAALFKKSDFEKSGGYDTAFNTALEDYDLWLNMIFKQNKTIYRVPEILFYYRLKPKEDSRNFQHRSEHKKLIKTLLVKYPQMRKYLLISKILKPFTKFGRFVFRVQNNKIKLFKIPVWTIKKYDTVISVGAACFVPETLKKLKLRDFSGPFDWMFGSHAVTRLKFIKNRFKNYFDFSDFEYVGENPDNGKIIYKNKKSGIVYNHDFPHGNFADIFEPVAFKYQRRITRTLEHLDNDNKVLLVFFELHDTGDKQQIIKIMNDINKKYRANIDLLYVNHNPNIKLGHHTPVKRISENVMYAEYHYKKFPDELPQATKICKQIVRKVAK